jgi:hypothetical protein
MDDYLAAHPVFFLDTWRNLGPRPGSSVPRPQPQWSKLCHAHHRSLSMESGVRIFFPFRFMRTSCFRVNDQVSIGMTMLCRKNIDSIALIPIPIPIAMIRIVHYPLSDRRLGVLHNWHTVPLRRKNPFLYLPPLSFENCVVRLSFEWPKREKPSSGPARTAGWPAGTPPRPKNGAGVEKTITPKAQNRAVESRQTPVNSTHVPNCH